MGRWLLLDLYSDAASALQKESGVALESETVTLFRQAILTGDWQLAESFLGSLPMENATDLLRVKFLIRQQKFLELLEEQKTMKALQVLRNELTPLGQNIERLHQLSRFVFFPRWKFPFYAWKLTYFTRRGQSDILLLRWRYQNTSTMGWRRRIIQATITCWASA